MLLVHARMTGSVRALKAAARYANASRSADRMPAGRAPELAQTGRTACCQAARTVRWEVDYPPGEREDRREDS
jgi:hypothetical protein